MRAFLYHHPLYLLITHSKFFTAWSRSIRFACPFSARFLGDLKFFGGVARSTLHAKSISQQSFPIMAFLHEPSVAAYLRTSFSFEKNKKYCHASYSSPSRSTSHPSPYSFAIRPSHPCGLEKAWISSCSWHTSLHMAQQERCSLPSLSQNLTGKPCLPTYLPYCSRSLSFPPEKEKKSGLTRLHLPIPSK